MASQSGPKSEPLQPDLGPRSMVSADMLCLLHRLQAPRRHLNRCLRTSVAWNSCSLLSPGLVLSNLRPPARVLVFGDFWGPFVHVRLSYTWCPACSLLIPHVGPHVLQCRHFVVIAAPVAVTSSPMFLFRLPALPISPHKNSSLSRFMGSF